MSDVVLRWTWQVAVVVVVWAATPVLASEWTQQIDKLVPALMVKHQTPGVSIAVVEERRLTWAKGYGVKQAGELSPVDTGTVFEACSMSKPLFGYAVMQLVEQGKLDLDHSLVEYLGRSYLEDQPLQDRITGRMVLTHTTGFPNWRKGGWRSGNPLAIEFEPGSQYGYSGEGFWFLQQAVETMVDEPLQPWMQRVVLSPIGMTSSSYTWRADYPGRAAAGHDSEGRVKADRPLYTNANSAFSLYTTPSDYARFLIEMMDHDRSRPQSLKQETIAAMLTPTIATGKPDEWRGLGWVLTRTGDRQFVSHSGSNGTGFRCYSWFDQEIGRGVVIMTNAVNGMKVWQGVMDEVLKTPDGG